MGPLSGPLTGLTIAVTRPRKQGETTAKALRLAGATAIELPLLEIVPLACAIDPAALADAYAVIFVSANAVEYGLPFLRKNAMLPETALIASIGEATTRALNEAGFIDVVSPQQSIDSEGLLALAQLQPARVTGQHVVLVRGRSSAGGRKLLEETLVARGARVVAVECYERRAIVPAPGQIAALINLMNTNFAIMALSVETLDSLMNSFAGHESVVKSTLLLVPHARVATAARSRGFLRIHQVAMSAAALVPELIALKPTLNVNRV